MLLPIPPGESRRCLLTGAAGFIGSHVASLLVEAGQQVLAIDDLSGGFRENVPEGSLFHQVSINEPLGDLFEEFKPEYVYHLAAYAAEGLSHHIPVFNYENNLLGTTNVLASAFRAGARHFIYASSIAVYGHPATTDPFDESAVPRPCDPYGIAKLACEHHIRAFHDYYGGPDYTIFRPHNVFGPRQNISDPYRNVVGIFLRSAIQGEPMPIFGVGNQTRSFSYVSSVAKAIAAAPWIPKAKGKTVNIGGDESMSVRALAETVAMVMDVPLQIRELEPRAEVLHAHCRHDLARSLFPHAYEEAIGIAEGLQKTADFVRRQQIPPATECPCQIEIFDRLPTTWAERLAPDRQNGSSRD